MTDRKVRTPAGEEYFGKPIGSPIGESLGDTSPQPRVPIHAPWSNPTVPPSITGYTGRGVQPAIESYAMRRSDAPPAKPVGG